MDSYLRLRLAHEEAASTFVYLLTPKASASYSELFKGDPDTFYGIVNQLISRICDSKSLIFDLQVSHMEMKLCISSQ